MLTTSTTQNHSDTTVTETFSVEDHSYRRSGTVVQDKTQLTMTVRSAADGAEDCVKVRAESQGATDAHAIYVDFSCTSADLPENPHVKIVSKPVAQAMHAAIRTAMKDGLSDAESEQLKVAQELIAESALDGVFSEIETQQMIAALNMKTPQDERGVASR